MTILLKNPADAVSYRVYVDNIGTADITSATFAVTGLSFGSIVADNTTNPKSVIVSISGGAHGSTYQGIGTFTLSTGGPLVRPITIRLFNS